MNRLRQQLQRLMMGRNGVDSLGRFALGASLLLILISGLLYKVPTLAGILDLAGIFLLAYSYFRIFSRNIPKRYQENQRFLKTFRFISKAAGDKTHRYYKCSSCGQTIRVPKGKGKIEITCPKCRNTFIKRT